MEMMVGIVSPDVWRQGTLLVKVEIERITGGLTCQRGHYLSEFQGADQRKRRHLV